MNHLFLQGDSIEVLKAIADSSIDSCVTDPPYGWRFMGKAWDGADIEKRARARDALGRLNNDGRTHSGFSDSVEAGNYDTSIRGNQAFQLWTQDWAREIYRVLKPGGHMLVFCGPRTYHRMASGVEDAGFEIRDQLQWLFGSGFPKSLNLGNGWGTALKPANEPIVLARKPLEKGLTVAQNVLKWGTGALNIDGCRVETDDVLTGSGTPPLRYGGTNPRPFHETSEPRGMNQHDNGRWPANVIHDGSEEVFEHFPEQTSGANPTRRGSPKFRNAYGEFQGQEDCEPMRGAETGSAARFFYCAKTDRNDRNAGLEAATNHHPTVKPTKLMQYLCRLVTPPGGIVLDPFLGSGSTAKAALIERFQCVGIEMDAEYLKIARHRLNELQVGLF